MYTCACANARRNADRVVAEAREHAEKQISDAMTESERERTMATRQVEDLNRQRESITSYLDELRHLLGAEPNRATLERAQQAEAAFEKEQAAAAQGRDVKAKPASRPVARGKARPAPVSAAVPVVASKPEPDQPAAGAAAPQTEGAEGEAAEVKAGQGKSHQTTTEAVEAQDAETPADVAAAQKADGGRSADKPDDAPAEAHDEPSPASH